MGCCSGSDFVTAEDVVTTAVLFITVGGVVSTDGGSLTGSITCSGSVDALGSIAFPVFAFGCSIALWNSSTTLCSCSNTESVCSDMTSGSSTTEQKNIRQCIICCEQIIQSIEEFLNPNCILMCM